MPKSFKHKIKFIASNISLEKENIKQISKASVDSLSNLFPDLAKSNGDLLAFAGNGCVVNIANANNHVIDTGFAKQVYKKFIGKQINADHTNQIVGVITNVSFTKFSENYTNGEGGEPINEPSDEDYNPFNISIGGYIFASMFPELAETLQECNDPNSPHYGDMSLSWEIAFNSAAAVVGSKKFGAEGNKVITDPEEFQSISGFFLENGGNGKMKNGSYAMKMPLFDKNSDGSVDEDSVWALGFAFTNFPAAAVRGVAIPTPNDKDTSDANIENLITNLETKQDNSIANNHFINTCPKCNGVSTCRCSSNNKIKTNDICFTCAKNAISACKNEEIENKVEINKNNISQNEKTNVIEIIPLMKKLKSFAELEFVSDENLKDYSVASIKEACEQVIRDADVKYKEIIEKDQKALAEVSQKAQDAESKLEALTKDLEQVKADLAKTNLEKDELAKAQIEASNRETFNTRMTFLDETYDLDDEVRKVIASDIADLDEAAFEKYKTKFAILAAGKKKGVVAPVVTENPDVTKIVASVNSKEVILNPSEVVTDPDEKFKNAFTLGDNVTLK